MEDIKEAVKYVASNKAANPKLSLTPRPRGTDMSGAAIGKSFVLDVSRYMTTLQELTATSAQVQPGKLYREFEGVLGGLFRVWTDVFASRRWGWVLHYFVPVSGSDNDPSDDAHGE